ncbi:tetratricopeptide repeat protein [Streptomyces sp. NPDC048717]|uniref:tetratricopeptide repeat protein n=1 Tax=Streptomyces sp. NPDC048717 TaxID=3154928 RepID=UPI003447DB69
MLQHLITQDQGLRMVPTDRDQLTTAVTSLREELQALPTGTAPNHARILARWTGIGLMVLGDHHGARTALQRALDLATADGNTRAAVAIELNLADAHRYAGEPETAHGYYRRALAGAQSRHPELVDYALQHYAKHLIEEGDLTEAHVHLREALQLRLVKGDAELIASTQAALDRVELLIGPDGRRCDIPGTKAEGI